MLATNSGGGSRWSGRKGRRSRGIMTNEREREMRFAPVGGPRILGIWEDGRRKVALFFRLVQMRRHFLQSFFHKKKRKKNDVDCPRRTFKKHVGDYFAFQLLRRQPVLPDDC